MQMISIRLPKTMIEGFKFISTHHHNIKYQTPMRQILQRFITSEIGRIGKQIMAEQHEQELQAEQRKQAA